MSIRVLMFVPQFPCPIVGGLEKQAFILTESLAHFGVQVVVLSSFFDETQSPKEAKDGVIIYRLTLPKSPGLRYICFPVKLALWLWFHRSGFDILHTHQRSFIALLSILMAKFLRKRVISKNQAVGLWGLHQMNHGPLGKIRTAIFKMADGMVAMTQETVTELQYFGYHRENILTVPNGIKVFPTPEQTFLNRDELRICRIVYVGRLDIGKGLEDLLNAWALIEATIARPAQLQIWGDGPLYHTLIEQQRELGLENSTVFRGKVIDVPTELRTMDVFVLPSHSEGNSNAVLEGMEAGLPIVSTRVGGTPMQVGPEGAPLLCEPCDVEGLAERLALLIDNPALRRRYGEAMRRRVEQHFDIQRIARIYMQAYECLTGQRQGKLSYLSTLPDAAT
jgi:glycosyltransferase involved in cell wall biosynthesis